MKLDTKSKLILSGEKLFSQKGYDATSISDICERAGVSKGAFFHYFPTKEAFFLEILDRWLFDLSVKIDGYLEDEDRVSSGIIRMSEIFREIFKESKEKFFLFLEFLRQGIKDKEILEKLREYFKKYKSYFSFLIEKGKKEGSLKDVDSNIISCILISFSIGTILQQIFAEEEDWEKIAREGIRIIISQIEKGGF
ncbi:MAG: TetR/AcrR family transcriptional regulator [Dictyoglomus turgidum]|uniref:TetR/AcrR family transcriptional regulator n=1 Tax=Dictyoglomus turgidum TaxID=513050 RepID=UPI003C749E7A